MDYIWKACVLALVCVLLYLVLAKKNPDIASVITVCGCAMILVGGLVYLEPVMSLLVSCLKSHRYFARIWATAH